MARRLDKNRKYGNIFGVDEHGAVFTQDGRNFNGQGLEVGPGVSEELEDPLRPGAAGPIAPEPTPPVVTVATDTATELKTLHPAQIKKLVEDAGLTPFGGAGSKAKNVALLLENAG